MHPTRREFLRISSGLAAATLTTAMPMNRAHVFGSAAREPCFLAGHFAPVKIEAESFVLTLRGAIPPELSGRYLRNGHNPMEGENPGAWFYGAGMYLPFGRPTPASMSSSSERATGSPTGSRALILGRTTT
jgi:hypothetical protein